MAGKKVKFQSPIPLRARTRLVKLAEIKNTTATQMLIHIITSAYDKQFGGEQQNGA